MTSKQKIVVTGSNGQLGSELKELSPQYPQYDFHFLTRAQLSLDTNEGLAEKIAALKPHYLINCAAYTAVDKAETEQALAMQINGVAVGALAKACLQNDIKFIHLSTDYVFDGTHKEPVNEDVYPSPINFYGESKFAGELLALQTNPYSIVIRTSWVYSFYGKNFVKTMIRLMGEKESVSVVNDQWGSPTYAADLAEAILQIINSGIWEPGIYHFSNEGIINWAQFAQSIANKIGSTCKVNPIPTASYPTPAKRPLYSVMDKTRIGQQYSIAMKSWDKSLDKCIAKLQRVADTA